MIESNLKTPGVYIVEEIAFPNSVIAVDTAVPAFIGYSPTAHYKGKSLTKKAQRITSFSEFKSFYCFPDPPLPASPVQQYSPQYYLVKQKAIPDKGDYLLIEGSYYSLVPDPNTIYFLYNSIRLFFENGGGTAYIVSVGSYGAPSKKPANPGEQIINTNVLLQDLKDGLDVLKNEKEPTMYICPEATLLSQEDNSALMQLMLGQCSEKQTAISVLDIIGGKAPDPINYTKDIEAFRSNTGNVGLSFGAAYYPFIGTNIMQQNEIDYTNLFGGDTKQLAPLLNVNGVPDKTVAAILADIDKPNNGFTNPQNNNALINASKTFNTIMKHVLNDANTLPPSGAMAGIMTSIDHQQGVWTAPANVSVMGASSLPIRLSDSQQGPLNMDAVTGKSINAIRFFNGLGILVWGARTLDGNSLDWKYLSVRRTVMMLEQSCKLGLQAYVFEPNNNTTWLNVKVEISNFLTTIWKQGGLQGASPAEAFSVECGLGVTMTPNDILNGFMNVTVKVAVTHPAEFIVFNIQQQLTVSC